MEQPAAPPLLVVLVSLVGVVSLMLVWFALAGNGPVPGAFEGAARAVSLHPLSLLGALHYLAFVGTAATLAWTDLARRGAGLPARAAWALAIVITGVLGAWAYLARRHP